MKALLPSASEPTTIPRGPQIVSTTISTRRTCIDIPAHKRAFFSSGVTVFSFFSSIPGTGTNTPNLFSTKWFVINPITRVQRKVEAAIKYQLQVMSTERTPGPRKSSTTLWVIACRSPSVPAIIRFAVKPA